MHYEDRGREKIAHVRHCKKFKSSVTNGRKDYVIRNNDIISNNLLNPRGEAPGSDDEADDLLTSKGGRSMRGNIAHMQKQRRKGKPFKRHLQPCRRRKMLLSHLEICFQDAVRSFSDVSSFLGWVNSVEGPSKVVGIQGVGAKDGHGDSLCDSHPQYSTTIRRRRIGFLQKQCGHRLSEEGAVMRTEERACEAAASFRRVTPGNGDVIMQEAPPAVVTSEAEQETPHPSVTSEAERYKRGFQG